MVLRIPLCLLYFRPQLIQLDMPHRQIFEEALVQFPRLHSVARQPCPQGAFLNPHRFLQRRDIDPQYQQQTHCHENNLGVCLQPIQQCVLPDGKFAFACLAKKIADALIFPMRSVSNQRVDSFICDLIIIALRVGAKVILGATLLFSSALAFGLTIWNQRCFGWRRFLGMPCLAIRAIFFGFWL